MTEAERAHGVRKRIAGLAMIVAPALLLISAIIQPELTTDEGAQLTAIAGDADAWYVAQLFALGAIVLAVPAVLGIMHMLRERRVLFGHTGGALALLGLLALMGMYAIQLVAWQMASAGADQAEMAALYERLHETTGLWIPFVVIPFAFHAGVVILAAGVALARAVHPAIAAAIAVGAILLAVALLLASELVLIAGSAILLLGVGAVGWIVLGETDEQWEHTPTVSGFRPVGAH